MALPKQISELIGAFSGMSNKDLLGIDIGTHSIKVSVVESLGKGQYKLNGFGIIELEEAVIIEDEIQKIDDVVNAVADAVRMSGSKSKNACLGVFGPNTTAKRLQVPDGSKEEIEDQISWESEQYIPFGVDDSELVHSIIGENEVGGIDVMMGAARIDLIEKYMDVLKQAGLMVKIVDLNIFALNNFFEIMLKDELEILSQNGAFVIDFGAQTTKVIVYKDGGPIITKEINIGGVLVTEEIQRQMGVSYQEAEDLKINGDESGNLPEEIVPLIDSHIENLLAELRKSITYYIQSGDEKILKCFITGGSANLVGLVEAITNSYECEVVKMNPLEILKIDKKINENLHTSIASSAAISIGLSLRCDG